MGEHRAELHAFYTRYLQRCNEHRFSELAGFVADDVEVNDAAMGLAGYGDGLQSVVDASRTSTGRFATSWSRTAG
jgi:predicted ester cyclase